MISSAQHNSGSVAGSLPVLTAESWHAPLTAELLARLGELLPAFIISRRWFRAKARTVASVLIQDVVPFAEHDSWLLVLLISYTEGEPDNYLLPVSLTSEKDSALLQEGSETFAHLQTENGRKGVLHSAFANPRFRTLILNAIANGQSFQGSSGTLVASKTPAPAGVEADLQQLKLGAPLESFVSRAEQSNTSIIFGDKFILKLFRKVEFGINPDIEIGKFLTEQGFAHTPAVLGILEYRSHNENATYAAGILQKFVHNEGDAWKYTLEALSGFFQRALSETEIPTAPLLHPLDLMQQSVPAQVAELIGSYLQSAALLGQRTAEMHAALASGADNPDFAPQPFTQPDAQKLHHEMLAQADAAFNVLRLKAGTLQGVAAENAAHLLASESAIRRRFGKLQRSIVTAQRIRFHGDYHLGQVLFTGSDFMIIDFEGEPARPLSERRDKTICLRDVAGMVRSFQYAGYAALFGQRPRFSAADLGVAASAAALWNSWISATYLRGYFEAAGNASFLPQTEDERRMVLDAFLLHKALYEVAYELNNRPDWVNIPLSGILSLLQ